MNIHLFDECTINTEYTPLLDAAARRRRQVLLADQRLDPAGDFLTNTPYEPGRHTILVPRLRADVRQHLFSVEHDREVQSGELRRRVVPLVIACDDLDEVPWGLVPLVDQAAVAHGLAVPVPPPSRVQTPFPDDRPDLLVSAHLLAHRRLVVRHGRKVHVAHLIAGLVRDLPGRRVAVVCSRRRDVGHLVAELIALRVEARGYYSAGHGHAAHPPRVAVGTPVGLTSSSAMATGCSIVICFDAVNFIGSGGVDLRAENAWLDAHWLGLVNSKRAVSPLERDRLTCFFGPAMLEVPAHDQVRRQVVFATQLVARPKGCGYERLVMELTGELAERELGGGSGRSAVVAQAAGIPGLVVVLADDARHRGDLQRELRQADRDRDRDRDRVRVVTPAELAAGVEIGVLVRADGRSGVPPFSDNQLTELQSNRKPMLVIDPVYSNVATTRERAYRAEGWVSLAAYMGGHVEWERWTNRPLPG